jgi:hypothetical protein
VNHPPTPAARPQEPPGYGGGPSRNQPQAHNAFVSRSPAIDQALEQGFSPLEIPRAREALPVEDQFSRGSPCEPIIIAVIQLASGDLAKLQHFADAATKDWRDVLYWAQTPQAANETENMG